MGGYIPEDIIDQIQDRCDIIEVISGYIPLKRAGRNFKALCPFHHEKTPSFIVSPDKQIYHCFGCQAGGNVFSFLMKQERLQFPEAVRMLAAKVGVSLPTSFGPSAEGSSVSSQIYRANELACAYYHHTLVKLDEGAGARRYLKDRGFDSQLIDRFKLGYAPSFWDGLLKYAKGKGISLDILEKAGLILPRETGGHYDRFRNRIIFPIFNLQNKVIGFGGRVLDESLPKYINSPETDVYIKGRHLYGLSITKDYIRDKDFVVIVEGYIDLLTPFQFGVTNIVASLGTALTNHQTRLLKRYTSNVVIVYDRDEAGEAASLRGLDLLIEEGLAVKVVNLPEGFDPDDYVRQYGGGDFERQIGKAANLFDYKLGLLTSKYDLGGVEDKAKIAGEMLPTISRVGNAVLKSGYIKKLAQVLSVDEGSVLTELKKVKRVYTYYEDKVIKPQLPLRQAEKMLVGFMLEDDGAISEVSSRLVVEDFQDPSIRKILEALFVSKSRGKSVEPSKLISKLTDERARQIISEVLASPTQLMDKKKGLQDCIKWIRQDNLKSRLKGLQAEIKLAQECKDDKGLAKLMVEYNDLMRSEGSYR